MIFENREYIPFDCPYYEVGTNNTHNHNALIMNTTLTKNVSKERYDFMNAIFFRVVFDRCDFRGANFTNAMFIQCEFLNCSSNLHTNLTNCVLFDTQLACKIRGDAMNAIGLDSSLPCGVNWNAEVFETYKDFVAATFQCRVHGATIRKAVRYNMLTNPRIWDM